MTRKKYEMTETMTDANGVRRVYGYRTDGTVVLINFREVLGEYHKRGLKDVEGVV